MASAAIDLVSRALVLRDEARAEKRAVAAHRRALREKSEALRRFCDQHGIRLEQIKDGEVTSWSRQSASPS